MDKDIIQRARHAINLYELGDASCSMCVNLVNQDTKHRKIIESLLKEVEAQQWQDIETAPRDGTHFLVTNGEVVACVYFDREVMRLPASNTPVPYSKSDMWMPLPPSPDKGDV